MKIAIPALPVAVALLTVPALAQQTDRATSEPSGVGAGTPRDMAIANPEKTQIQTEDGQVIEPGPRIPANPDLGRALDRLSAARSELAALAERFADAPARPGPPEGTERAHAAQEVIGRALQAIERVEHSDAVADDAQIIQDTRLQLTEARRALAEDDAKAGPQIDQAAAAVGALRDRMAPKAEGAAGQAMRGVDDIGVERLGEDEGAAAPDPSGYIERPD